MLTLMAFYIALSLLSNIQFSSASPKHEARHKEGRKILSQLDKEICGSEESYNQTILTSASGKPYFTDHHAAFSISHSASLAAAAYIAGSETEIGCDIQYINPRKKIDSISARFYHPNEQAFIDEANTVDEKRSRFYRIWVLKESFIKMMGWSVFDMLKTPTFVPQEKAFSFNQITCYVKEYGDEQSGKYMLGATLNNSEEITPIIKWYSETCLQD
jgi:phosphopantetheinyl transferase